MYCCGCAGKSQEPPVAEHGFSVFVLWLELLLQGFCVPS